MSDAVLAAIMVAVFLLAIGLIRLLDRMISRDADPEGPDGFADEPPDTGEAPDGGADRPGRPR